VCKQAVASFISCLFAPQARHCCRVCSGCVAFACPVFIAVLRLLCGTMAVLHLHAPYSLLCCVCCDCSGCVAFACPVFIAVLHLLCGCVAFACPKFIALSRLLWLCCIRMPRILVLATLLSCDPFFGGALLSHDPFFW
jgi:hypothetical protein